MALVESFQATPFAALVILGGLAALPAGLYEASKIDGASAIQRFRYLTLPLVWPYIVVVLLIRSVDALKAFDSIFVLTQGGPGRASETINILLFLQAFNFYHVGYSASMVVMLFILGCGGGAGPDSTEKGSVMVVRGIGLGQVGKGTGHSLYYTA